MLTGTMTVKSTKQSNQVNITMITIKPIVLESFPDDSHFYGADYKADERFIISSSPPILPTHASCRLLNSLTYPDTPYDQSSNAYAQYSGWFAIK